MASIIFDIETTGLSHTESSPIEFAYLEVSNAGLPSRCGCMYIKPYKSEWTAGAEAVHHISRATLEQHGVEPEYAAANIWALLHNNDVITYNGKSFDIPLLRGFCSAVGTALLYEKSHTDLCTLWPSTFGGKRRKMEELVAETGISIPLIERMTQVLFGDNKIYQPHDARYDVVATYYLYKKYLEGVKAQCSQAAQTY